MSCRRQLLLLAVFIVFLRGTSLYWHALDRSLWGCDIINHLMWQSNYWHNLNSQSMTDPLALFNMALNRYGNAAAYPPVFYIVSSIGQLGFGNSATAIIFFTNTVFILILAGSLLLLGRRLFDLPTAILATAVLLLFPAVFGQARWYGASFTSAPMIVFVLYLLHRTDGFSSTRRSIVFGLGFALGLMTKYQEMAFFIIGPLCLTIISAYRKKACTASRHPQPGRPGLRLDAYPTLNIIIAIILAGLVSACWWFPNLRAMINIIAFTMAPANIVFEPTQVAERYSLYGFVYNIINLPRNISQLWFIIFLISLTCVGTIKRPVQLFLASWVFVPYIIVLYFHRWDRYFFPAFPALALIIAHGLNRIRPAALRRSIIALALFLGILQYLSLSFSLPFEISWQHPSATIIRSLFPEERVECEYVRHPRAANYQDIGELFVKLIRHHRPDTRNLKIGFIEEWDFYGHDGPRIFGYYLLREFPDATFTRNIFWPRKFFASAAELDYLIVIEPNAVAAPDFSKLAQCREPHIYIKPFDVNQKTVDMLNLFFRQNFAIIARAEITPEPFSIFLCGRKSTIAPPPPERSAAPALAARPGPGGL